MSGNRTRDGLTTHLDRPPISTALKIIKKLHFHSVTKFDNLVRWIPVDIFGEPLIFECFSDAIEEIAYLDLKCFMYTITFTVNVACGDFFGVKLIHIMIRSI
jgi:hypothetical protein